jgi:hypothetical protein
MRVLQESDTALSRFLDSAPVKDFWLKGDINTTWAAPWEDYPNLDATRKETTKIQPVWNEDFISTFPRDKWQLSDTHTGWNKLTQDCLMHATDQLSELAVGVVIELVGQDETGWPSKAHRGKFVRDLIRVYHRRGGIPVQGVITDLARVMAVKLEGIGEDGEPRLVKTAVLTGSGVKKVFLAFAAASTEDLFVTTQTKFMLRSTSGLSVRTQQAVPDRILGRGAQGCVFLLRGPVDRFLKDFTDQQHFSKEVEALRALNASNVSGVPTLLALDNKQHAFAATPVGTMITMQRGKAWLLIAATCLASILQETHNLKLVHRDVRPSNIITKDNDVYLLDWACAAAVGNKVLMHAGTVYYAAIEVLEALNNKVPYEPKPSHDLESLVYVMDAICVANHRTSLLSQKPILVNC